MPSTSLATFTLITRAFQPAPAIPVLLFVNAAATLPTEIACLSTSSQ